MAKTAFHPSVLRARDPPPFVSGFDLRPQCLVRIMNAGPGGAHFCIGEFEGKTVKEAAVDILSTNWSLRGVWHFTQAVDKPHLFALFDTPGDALECIQTLNGIVAPWAKVSRLEVHACHDPAVIERMLHLHMDKAVFLWFHRDDPLPPPTPPNSDFIAVDSSEDFPLLAPSQEDTAEDIPEWYMWSPPSKHIHLQPGGSIRFSKESDIGQVQRLLIPQGISLDNMWNIHLGLNKISFSEDLTVAVGNPHQLIQDFFNIQPPVGGEILSKYCSRICNIDSQGVCESLSSVGHRDCPDFDFMEVIFVLRMIHAF